MNHKFHKSILRAYDIRGIYNETIFDNDAFFVGRSFGTFLARAGKGKIAVGCDGRVSSPFLKERLIQGLLDSGLEVVDIGVGPTPMLFSQFITCNKMRELWLLDLTIHIITMVLK